MRRELREAVGRALGFSQKHWEALDCVESADVFLVIKPDGRFARHHFNEAELRPLLRQAVVAISAAVEAYVAEKAMTYIASALKDPPERMRTLPVSLSDVMWINSAYKRPAWAYRAVVEAHVLLEASPDPAKIGKVFAVVGKRGFWPRVDAHRKVLRGSSEKQLAALYGRRNQIAHTGDRVGRRRASLSLEQVQTYYGDAKSIVEALEAVL